MFANFFQILILIFIKCFHVLPSHTIAFSQTSIFTYITGDGSASTLWDNRRLLKYHKDKDMKLPPFTNAYILKRLNPNSKIIIMRKTYLELAIFCILFI